MSHAYPLARDGGPTTAAALPALAETPRPTPICAPSRRKNFKPISLAPTIHDGNMLIRERIDLGAKLFFDPRMSRSGLFSCQSCHNVGLAGVDGLETSIGHGWQKGRATPPPC